MLLTDITQAPQWMQDWIKYCSDHNIKPSNGNEFIKWAEVQHG